jgi:acyl transferase domain-containing protein/NADPH:quinone reductase-like Zn-dependent oxidoreductase/lauroyl/myristoyl acyltransferase/NADP-dependent 3-hydroxy acid dehydrogenase YdfG/acyl carrier protein
MSRPEPIAIAGIGCRFPGGVTDADSFWRLLMDGVDAITEIPADRWSIDKYYDPTPGRAGKSISKWGGFVGNPAAFDHEFFGLSPREAASLDPQHRMLLLTAAEALQDARQPAAPTGQAREIGVFVGVSTHDYSQLQSAPQDLKQLDAWSLNSTAATLAANRISYAFDLSGPSFPVDTACSSSLVAVHLACEAIRRGQCRAALAGGANALYHAGGFVTFSRAGMLSPTGRCRAFDKSADGFVRAEGAGLVFLLPTSEARAQGLRIYAEILGTAVNQDGRKPSMTAPATQAQAALIRTACHQAGIDPSEIQYMEAHGTGTQVGDPSEAAAIAASVGAGRRTPCLLGSVKTNIGHLEAAAGIAGTIKAALCLHHGEVPPNLHFHEPNPALDLAGGNLRLVTQTERLQPENGRLLAGVNSFGFGGANAHAILAGVDPAPPQERPADDDRGRLLVVSARRPDVLSQLAGSYAELLERGPENLSLDDLCLSAGLAQSLHPHRLALCGNRAQLRESLTLAAQGGCPPGASRGRAEEHPAAPVFVFCGQGSQWAGMGCELQKSESVFRAKLVEIDHLIRANVGWSLLRELDRDENTTRLNDTEIAQPAIFAIQMALVALWNEWGIRPSAVVGHSVGEAAASCVSGVLSLAEATRVICHRAKSMAVCRGRGTMLSVALPVKELQALVSGRPGRVAIGAINSPRSAVLSGEIEDIALLGEELTGRGVPLRKVRVEYAFHSALMDPARGPLEKALAHIRTQRPNLPLFSTVTGEESTDGAWDAGYWWRNIRQPVLFSATIARMLACGHRTFLEVGPHPVLGGSLLECLHTAAAGADTRVFSSIRRQKPERETMLAALGALAVSGQQPDWPRLYPSGRRIDLPRYPWKLESPWAELPESRSGRLGGREHPLLGPQLSGAPGVWHGQVQVAQTPFLADHAVNAQPIFPAAAYLDMAWAAGRERGMDFPLCVENLDFVKALPLGADAPPLNLRFALGLDGASFEVTTSAREEGAPWVLHARGRLAGGIGIIPPAPTDLDALRRRLPDMCDGDELRANLLGRGLKLGPTFTGLVSAAWREGESLGVIRRPEILGEQPESYLFHPAFLDACFGTLVCAFPGWRSIAARSLFLPVTFDRVRLHAVPGSEVHVHARLTSADSHLLTGDLTIMDADGRCLAEFKGFRARAVATADAGTLLETALYEEQWIEAEAPATTSVADRRFLVLGDRGGTAAELIKVLAAHGAHCTPLSMPPPDTIEETLRRALAQNQFDGIVHCWNLDAGSPADHGGTLPGTASLLALYRVLATAQAGAGTPPQVHVLTRGARSTQEGDPADPAQAAACGVVRTARLELPHIAGKLVDFDGPANAATAAALVAEIATDDGESEVALRGGVRHVPRLRRGKAEHLRGARAAAPQEFQIRLRQPGPGVEVRLAQIASALPPGHVRIRVEAAGVNFRDAMKALGIYPVVSDLDLVLGDECTGLIEEVGPDVHSVRPGDRVLAVTPGCFATTVVAPQTHVVPCPEKLHPADGATLPVVFMTALYALREVGRIRPGDRVLIHSAAGGVGLAAVQVAQMAGAEVFATAGSADKRARLAELGVRHIMDSRSLAFRDAIMDATGGRGVDLVLNSLAGEFLVQSLACLAPGGRFLEIGKRDIYENAKLGLAAFRANQSFSAIDMAQILQHNPAETQRLLSEIANLVAAGELRPLPRITRPLTEVAEALRELAQGRHIGKMVLEVAPPLVDRPNTGGSPPFRADSTYIVTGGVRGFGLASAEWLVTQGARHLALVGRSGTRPAALEAALARWQDIGVEARIFQTDLADPAEVARLFADLRDAMPPVRGIIHAATRYESATLANADAAGFIASIGPKSLGAWNLHETSRDLALDFFVLYASVAGVLGNAGQAAYAAANAFLTALAASRRACSRPALAVSWGVLSDAGHVADHAEIGSLLESRGLGGMTATEATGALGELMATGATEAIVARIRWTRDEGGLGIGADSPRLRELVSGGTSTMESGGASARDAILGLPADERLPAMTTDLVGQLAEVLRLPAASIAPDAPLQELGLDSLIAIETVIRLERRFGVSLAPGWMSADTTVADLAQKLLHLATTGPSPVTREAALAAPDDAVERRDHASARSATAAGPAAGLEHVGREEYLEDAVGIGFRLEWLALRAVEKFFLGRDVASTRRRLATALPAMRLILRHDWQWARKNLRMVFGPNLNDREHLALASLAMENHLASYLDGTFSHQLEFGFNDYAELLELAGDRGVILCGVHLGSWEPILRWAPDIGLRLAAVYRRARNPLAEKVFQERRSRYGIEWIASSDTRAIARAVDERKIVAFMTDLNTYEGRLFTDFLGVPASCAPGPGSLAVLKDVPLVPAVGIRESAGKVAVHFAPALRPQHDQPVAAEVARLSAALNGTFAPWILEYAEQYNWLHPRWRRRPDDKVWTLRTTEAEMAAARTTPYAVPSARLLGVIASAAGAR